jgi:hypothetical protein
MLLPKVPPPLIGAQDEPVPSRLSAIRGSPRQDRRLSAFLSNEGIDHHDDVVMKQSVFHFAVLSESLLITVEGVVLLTLHHLFLKLLPTQLLYDLCPFLLGEEVQILQEYLVNRGGGLAFLIDLHPRN